MNGRAQLVAAGAAGGIAAAFNAPIAEVFFALEIVLGEFTGNAMGVVVLASVISAVFTQAVSGAQPAFCVPAYAFNSEWELAFYLGLGLLAGPVAALYVRLLYRFSDLLHGWRAPRWLKPVLAGLLIGLVGVFLPQVFGVGYNTIEGVIGGKPYALGLLGLLLVAKIFLTPISIGSGFQGGVFAPALYLGAMLGGAYAMVMNLLVPAAHLNPAGFAMVGMAAVLAGAVHAPLTAIILLFEMTNDYHIILPLMFAVIVSLFVSQLLQRQSMYDLSLSRKGIQLQRGRDVEVLEAITVGEVMRDEVDTLNESDSLPLAMDRFSETRHHGLAVLDKNGKLAGVITVQDLEHGRISPDADTLTVGDVMSRDLLVTYPEETIGDARRRMGLRDIGRLPVVSPDDEAQLLGVLTRTDLVRAYDVALTRRAAMRHKAHQVRLGAISGVSVEEVTIQRGAECDGKRVSDVEWPADCVLATIRRGRKVIFLHGDTVLRPGDVLVAVADEDARDELEFLCTRQLVQAAIGDE